MDEKENGMFEFIKLLIVVITGAYISFYVNQKYGLLEFDSLLEFNSIGDVAGKTALVLVVLAITFWISYLILQFITNIFSVLFDAILSPFGIFFSLLTNLVYSKYPNIVTKALDKYVKSLKSENEESRKDAKFLSKFYYPYNSYFNILICLILLALLVIFPIFMRQLLRANIGVTIYIITITFDFVYWSIKSKSDLSKKLKGCSQKAQSANSKIEGKKEINSLGKGNVHMLFTERDEILNELKYKSEPELKLEDKLKFRIKFWIFIAIFALAYLYLLYPHKLTFTSPDNLRYIFSGSAQTLGAILGISISMILIFTQLNLKRFSSQIIKSIVTDYQILSYFFFILFTIGANIYVLTTISETQIKNTFILYATILFFVFLSILAIPLILDRLFQIINAKRIIRNLEIKLHKSIDSRDIPSVESIIHSFAQIIENAIITKDRDVLKEGIDTLHDFVKYYLRNNRLMFENLELISDRERGMHSHSDWLLDEILSYYVTFFRRLIDTHQYNSAKYLLSALDSCGVESLNYPLDRGKTMIADSYREMFNYMLKLDDETYKRYSRIFSQFFKYSLKLSKRDTYFTVYGFFSEEFLISILKKKPWRIDYLVNIWYDSMKFVEGYLDKWNKENIPYLVSLVCNIMSVSKFLERHKEFNRLLSYQNENLREHFSDLCVLFGIFCLYKGWENLAIDCKKNYNKTINEKKVFQRINKELKKEDDDIRNLTINHEIHFLFEEYNKKKDKTYFDFKKFSTILANYKKLKT